MSWCHSHGSLVSCVIVLLLVVVVLLLLLVVVVVIAPLLLLVAIFSGQRGPLRYLPQELGHRASNLHQLEQVDCPDHLLIEPRSNSMQPWSFLGVNNLRTSFHPLSLLEPLLRTASLRFDGALNVDITEFLAPKHIEFSNFQLCWFVTSNFGGFVWSLCHMFCVCIGSLDDWMIWLWSQGSKPTWCHTHASTSCWPPMHQSSLQRRHTMSSCPWQRSPCLSSSQPPWWWSAILATASTWPAAWCTAAARQKITGGKLFRSFSESSLLEWFRMIILLPLGSIMPVLLSSHASVFVYRCYTCRQSVFARRCSAKGCECGRGHDQDQAYHSVCGLVPNWLQVRHQLSAANRCARRWLGQGHACVLHDLQLHGYRGGLLSHWSQVRPHVAWLLNFEGHPWSYWFASPMLHRH